MGNSSSAAANAARGGLLSCILNSDLEGTAQLLLAHPELLTVSLDLDHGHNAVHLCVITRQHAILSYVVSCAHIPAHTHGRLEAALMRSARQAVNQGRFLDGATPMMLACDIGDETAVRRVVDGHPATELPVCPESRRPYSRSKYIPSHGS